MDQQLEVTQTADWVVDLGPEGGNGGGRIVAEGTPEAVAAVAESYTGQYLAQSLRRPAALPAPPNVAAKTKAKPKAKTKAAARSSQAAEA